MEEETKVSLKLLVDPEGKRILFAEANKDFVDFLFHIMSLPVGTLGRLYQRSLQKSIESFRDDYLQEGVNKDAVLNPRAAVNVPLLSINDVANAPNTEMYYRCGNHHAYVTNDCNSLCPSCYGKMGYSVTYVASKSLVGTATSSNGRGGYVKDLMTYMVMDNLEIKPLSTISAITILNKFRIKDVTSLVEKEVQVGFNEGVAILKASLETQAVLTTVFLGQKVDFRPI